jgi:hypothetical protein
VFEGVVEPDNVINGNLRHSLRFREAQVDGDATPTLRAKFQFSPIRHAATCGAEMKSSPSRYVGLGWAEDTDALAFKAVCPKHAVAATYGAIARLGRLSDPFEAPLNCTAVAGTLNHFEPPFRFVARRSDSGAA